MQLSVLVAGECRKWAAASTAAVSAAVVTYIGYRHGTPLQGGDAMMMLVDDTKYLVN